MANAQVKNPLGFVDKRLGGATATHPISATTASNVKDITSMRARLTAINAGYYTAARLDQMTVNDMIYAIRLNDEAGSV